MGLFDGTPLERPILCDRCGTDIKICRCPPPDVPASDQRLQVLLEKRKFGKVVTIVRGFTGHESQVHSVGKELRNACGTGGTCQGDCLELQGDHVKRVSQWLSERGYKVVSR